MKSELFSRYTAPLSEAEPAGPNLEYDARMIALDEASVGEPERSIGDSVIPATPPDWRDVEKQASVLMAETRDVRVAVIWTIARLANAGTEGLLDGLEIIRTLAADMWEAHWPQPDDGDVQERISALTRLSPVPGSFDADATVLHLLLETPLTASPNFGGISLSEVREAKDGSDAQRRLTAALMDTPAEKAETLSSTLAALKETLTAIRDIYVQHGEGAPDFRLILDLLKEMQMFLDSRPAAAPAAAPAETPMVAPAAEAAPSAVPSVAAPASVPAAAPHPVDMAPLPTGAAPLQGRQQVTEQLRQICAWFEANEPSSPVPYFLRRAIRCIGADFMDILKDIVPSAQEQVRVVLRPDASQPSLPQTPAPSAAPEPAPSPAPSEQDGFFNPFG